MEQARDSEARSKRRENSQVRERDTQNFAELRSGEYGITESVRRNMARRVQRRDPDVKEKERQEKAFIRQVRIAINGTKNTFLEVQKSAKVHAPGFVNAEGKLWQK